MGSVSSPKLPVVKQIPAIKGLPISLEKVLHRVIHSFSFSNDFFNSAKVLSLCIPSYYPLVGPFGLF
jgi:hypothetical protein